MSEKIIKGNFGEYRFNDSVFLKKNGKFNDVFLGIDIKTKNEVLIKRLNSQNTENEIAVNRFLLESHINFEHISLSKSLDYFTFENDIFLIREFFEGIDLKNFTKPSLFKKNFKEDFWIKILIQVLEGLQILHEKGIIHRDIRPSNIIILNKNIDFKENPKIKIIDFGLAKSLENEESFEREPFSLIYSPPEQLLNFNSLVSVGSDLYSLAITFYELISDEKLFRHSNPEFSMNLMITQTLKPSKKISNQLFNILSKASAKKKFIKPPRMFSYNELYELLEEGVKFRYSSASEMLFDLKEIKIR
jgi:serine/threonine protein kinase